MNEQQVESLREKAIVLFDESVSLRKDLQLVSEDLNKARWDYYHNRSEGYADNKLLKKIEYYRKEWSDLIDFIKVAEGETKIALDAYKEAVNKEINCVT